MGMMGCRFRRLKVLATVAGLTVWLGAGAASAGTLSFSASVDRATIFINQPLRLTITLSGELPPFDQPVDFEMPKPFVVAARSQSTKMSIGGGSVERSVSFLYVLVSPEAGSYRLGPFQLECKGRTMATEPISIIVKKPILPPGAEQQPRVTL